MRSNEFPILRSTPKSDLENRIKYLRRCVHECPMVATLDERLMLQRELVAKILKDRDIDLDEFSERPLEMIIDPELILLWHILKDADYIDSLK
jgi:hypothetical protein